MTFVPVCLVTFICTLWVCKARPLKGEYNKTVNNVQTFVGPVKSCSRTTGQRPLLAEQFFIAKSIVKRRKLKKKKQLTQAGMRSNAAFIINGGGPCEK